MLLLDDLKVFFFIAIFRGGHSPPFSQVHQCTALGLDVVLFSVMTTSK